MLMNLLKSYQLSHHITVEVQVIKKYITNDFQSLEHVYRVYVEYCKLNNVLAVPSGIFKKR